MVFKMIFGIVELNFANFFPLSNLSTRGHPLKLFKNQVNTSVHQNYFSEKVVSASNSLPESIIGAKSMKQFKNELSKRDFRGFLNISEVS